MSKQTILVFLGGCQFQKSRIKIATLPQVEDRRDDMLFATFGIKT